MCVCVWKIFSLLCAVCPWSGRVRCVLSSAGSGPGYDTVFSVVLMRTLQRSDAGCKFPSPLRSVSLHLWPILRCERELSDRIVCDGSVLQFCFKYDTCKHGRCCVVITVLVQWFSLSLLLSIFPPPVHKCSTSSLCVWCLYDIVCIRLKLSRGVKMFSALSQRWCSGWSPCV